MRYELKSIGIWSYIKVAFFVNGVIGFLIGLFYAMFFGAFVSLLESSPFADRYGMDSGGMSFGFMLIAFPILFAIMAAFFQTILMALIVGVYNLVVRMTGGVVLNLEGLERPGSHSIPVTQPSAAPSARPAVSVPPPPPPPKPEEPEQSLREIRKQVDSPPSPSAASDQPPAAPSSPPVAPPPPKRPEENKDDNPEAPTPW